MLDSLNNTKDKFILKLKKRIRKKAMKRVEKQMAYNEQPKKYLLFLDDQKTASDYSKEELRKLIETEEKDIVRGYKMKSTFSVLMAMLGINYLG